MDSKIADAQTQVLKVFSRIASRFALAGGTALQRCYLHHRFSWDLDFFSPAYDVADIDRLTTAFKKHLHCPLKLEADLTAGGRARVRFYSMPVRGADRPLKIDFVEDVLIKTPSVQILEGVRVYSAENIYLQKIAAMAGTRPELDAVGRAIMEGRHEPRDAFDLYMLSRKIMPLHRFLSRVPAPYQKGIIHWYRTFSRHDLKLGVLDMEIYVREFDVRAMIAHLENEIRLFAKNVVEE